MDELPDIDTVDQYTGIFVTGSHCSANESQQWIHKESDWLRSFAQRPTTCKLVASCFGCQVQIPACLLHLPKASKPKFLRCRRHCTHDLALLLEKAQEPL